MTSAKELGELLRSTLSDVDTELSIYVEDAPAEEQRGREMAVQRALNYLNDQTFGRIDADMDEAVLSTCGAAWLALVDVLEGYRGAESKRGINSETVGGWSRSYAGADALEKSREKELQSTLRRYLGHTGLLYRGCD